MSTLKTGEETLFNDYLQKSYSLLDFWRWNTSDLLSNATRGRLAEFIVASATGVNLTMPREEWASYDLTTSEGIKVEVKSSAYLQSWVQTKPSVIKFGIKPTKAWDPLTNLYGDLPKRNADVYVFCLLSTTDKEKVDPLDLDQWEFYVVSTKRLDAYTKSTTHITLNRLKEFCMKCVYKELDEKIRVTHLENSFVGANL